MHSDVTEAAAFFKAWAWLDKNKKQVGYAVLGIAVVSLGVWFVVWQQDQKRVAAGEALSRVFVPQTLPQPGGDRRAEPADDYLKVASQYQNSSAESRALLLAGAALFTQGKFADAQTQFDKFLREKPDSSFTSQALLGVAACLDAQNKTNEAITAYKNLVDRRPNDSSVPQAKFALARLYEAQQKPELARPLLEDVARTDPYGGMGAEAGMRLEELKLKYPSLVPPVAPSTNAAASANSAAALQVLQTLSNAAAAPKPEMKAATNAAPVQKQ